MAEFEDDCKSLFSEFANYQRKIASATEADLVDIRGTFRHHQEPLSRHLTDARGSRKKDKLPESTSELITKSRGPKIKLDLPKFSGNPTDWRHFHCLFTSALEKRGDAFSQHEKACLLLQAMSIPEAQQIVQSYSHADDGYDQAMEVLTYKYGSPRIVFPLLVHKKMEKSTIEFSDKGFSLLVIGF